LFSINIGYVLSTQPIQAKIKVTSTRAIKNMTLLIDLQLGDQIYTVDLFPQTRVAIAKNLLALYHKYCNEVCEIEFEDWLSLVEAQPHPLEEVNDSVDLSFSGIRLLRRKDWGFGVTDNPEAVVFRLGMICLIWN
jgi:hypothetical protein